LIEGLVSSVFGPEYYGAQFEDLGVYDVPAGTDPVDVIDGNRVVLPPAAYVVRYVTGEYMLVGAGQDPLVGGPAGLQVRWNTFAGDWVTTEFPEVPIGQFQFSAGWNLGDLVYCELMGPGRIQLVPPTDLHGTASFRIIRAIPQYAPFSSQPY
jgi:hypothetical protein